jgi:hypothetical protein
MGLEHGGSFLILWGHHPVLSRGQDEKSSSRDDTMGHACSGILSKQ